MESSMGNSMFYSFNRKTERDQYEEGFKARCRLGNVAYQKVDFLARGRIPYIHGWAKAHGIFAMEAKRND